MNINESLEKADEQIGRAARALGGDRNKIIQAIEESKREFREEFRNGATSTKRNDEIESFLTRSYAALLSAVESEMPGEDIRRDMTTETMVSTPTARAWNACLGAALKPIQEAREFISKD